MSTSDLEQQTQDIELSIEDARKNIAVSEALDRLSKTKDWQLLIDQQYFKEEPARLAILKGAPGAADPRIQDNIIKDIDGIGSFFSFLLTTKRAGMDCKRAIEDSEEQLELIAQEIAEGAEE